ncbi:MAG: GAF domain-containing protein, partial [candidate division NC10 bacterium]
RLIEEAAQVSGSEHVKVLLFDLDESLLRVAAVRGTALEAGATLPLGVGLSGLVAATRQPQFSPDMPNDPRNPFAAIDRELGIVTYLGLPIQAGDSFLGVLTFNTTFPREYSAEEREYLASFASQAGFAIQRALLFQTERAKQQQLQTARQIGEEITHELHLPTVLDLITRRAMELLGAGSGSLFLWDAAAQELVAETWYGLAAELEGRRLRLGQGVAGVVAERREAMIVNDFPSFSPASRIAAARSGVRRALAQPLVYRDQLVGVLVVRDKTDGAPFAPDDLGLLGLLATQAAIAIENARLYADQQAAVEKLRQAQAELVRAEKLRALGQMSAGIAHDLNNTLAAALGQVELLQLQMRDPGVRETLRRLETAIMDGAMVVRRLQAFARQEARADLSSCDLAAIVREAVELTRPRWEDEAQRRGVTIGVTTALEDLPPVLGHAPELREALVNLIFNAVDAMPTGGMLTLAGRLVPATDDGGRGTSDGGRTTGDGPDGGLQSSVPGRWVELTVSDTGVGMSEEVRQRVFDPFYTTKGIQGSGLGLSMVYGIMQRHAGQIEVASTHGEGTRFTLRFRVANQMRAATPEESVLSSVPPRRLLVIDDEPAVRDSLALLLQSAGHTVLTAPDGPSGLQILETADVACVLTDLGMSGMTGWEVARAVKALHPDLPVILLSGWMDQTASESALEAVDRSIGKPVRIRELLTIIAELTAHPPKTGTT